MSTCCLSRPVRAQTGTLTADTAVTSAHPATNYGTLSNLYISSGSTALLRFDLGTLPSGTTATQVSRATLRVFVNRVNTPGVLTVSPVNAAWAEGAVTSQTLPTTGNAVEVFAITDEGQFVTVDVTSLVQGWITSPATNFGLALTATAADVVLDSKENDTTAHPAQLEIALASGTVGPAGPQGPKGDAGATGAQGLPGLVGPTGATGPAGPQGLQGLQGPKGDTGAAGTGAGMAYRGSWTAGTAYAVNDVVTFGGAAWVSTAASNVGNTPAGGSSVWGVLVPAATSSGTTTVTGGLAYAGAYASTTNYASQAVVTWQNAAWVSLHDSNHGNTPSSSALDWAVLVPAASSGSGGTTTIVNGLLFEGAYASTTNYGTNQVVTWQSAAWVSLVDSNHGNTPSESAADWAVLVPASTNPASITTIINGLLFDGGYISGTNYATNHVVTWQNAAFVSLHDSNHGNTPDGSPNDWATLVPAAVGLTGPQGPAGATGATGPQGERGYTGDTGAQGERGATGATGRPGFVYQGVYASTTNYAAGDVVLWQGGSWASLVDGNHGNTPDGSPTDWGTLTTRGLTGDTGATGAQGPAGPQGLPGTQGLVGPQGPTGPVGSTGPQGAPGRDGTQGPQGNTGSVGAKGDPGPVGLTWQGTYVSTTNYATNDAVAWQGQTWLSLHDTNHGNTPDASPSDWTLLAAAGATGAQGPQGAVGPQGGPGATGPQGPQGNTGAGGPTGPQGVSGMQFLGPYNSTKNYALHDAVSFGGGTWISVQDANHGNAPGASPAWWQQIAAPGQQGATGTQGPTGTTGTAGPVGPQGSVGPAGPQGQPVHFLGAWSATASYLTGDAVFYGGSAYIATGAVTGDAPGVSPLWSLLAQHGDTGAAGPQGPQGVQGAAGATGPAGATGATGAAGLRWRGTYDPAAGYITGDAVAYNGASYVSVSDTNVGVTPGSGSQWLLLAAAGATGAAGANGSNGARGNDGAAATIAVGNITAGAPGSAAIVQNVGTPNAATLNFTLPQGATGAAGAPGLTYQGTWSSGTGYAKNDVVFRSGSSYVSQVAGNTSDPAESVTNNTGDWKLLVSQGAPGAATVSIGTVSSGTTAAVANSGTQNAAVLNFTLPRGDTGAAGPAGLTFTGAWDASTPYPATTAVSYNGSSYIARVASTGVHPVGDAGSAVAWLLLAAQGTQGPAGAQGATGLTGATGTTPTITVGSTTTLAAGNNASVTATGTATGVQLQFSIPQGAAGTGGGTSSGGVYSSVHTVPPASQGSQVYSPLVDAKGAADISAVLAYLPATCKVSSVLVYNASAVDATFAIHTGTPGNMSSVASCTAKALSATTCTGPGILGSTNFMSFEITTTNTATSYLYTQFSCN